MKRFRVHTEDLNAYGFWVMTEGLDTSDFEQNPICLYNHIQAWRGTEDEILPIAIWEDLKKEGGTMSAVPKFDMDDEFAAKIANKVEKGYLRACSIGISILEWSEDPANLKPGQTRPTVVKSKLREISICDIPANKNAVTFYDQSGDIINLSDNASLEKLPVLKLTQSNSMKELEILALSLGLRNDASLSDIQSKIADNQAKAAENDLLKAELKLIKDQAKQVALAESKSLLDAALSEQRINADQRAQFEKLFESNHDAAKVALASIPKPVSPLNFIAPQGGPNDGKFTYQGKSFSQLSKDDPALLEMLRSNDMATFSALYKAEFGREYKTTDKS